MEINKKNIIKTLCYFDIFDYPLRLFEINRYLVGIKLSRQELIEEIRNTSVIDELNGYYFLLGREKNVTRRIDREKISETKLKKAKSITRILSKIPFIKLIGISGSLSMKNSNYNDDIDMFFITRKNTLWIGRLLVLMVLIISRQKRNKGQKTGKDKICPNMFLSENELTTEHYRRNLYMAHEISQLRVLYNKDGIYDKFMFQNKWIRDYLPNLKVNKISSDSKKNKKTFLIDNLLQFINSLFYAIQVVYMKKSMTIERVNAHMAMFHPVDKGALIMDYYQMKVNYSIGILGHKIITKRRDLGTFSASKIN